MSWNESGNGKDPWKGGGNQPDDLDKIIEGWQKKINAILGGKKRQRKRYENARGKLRDINDFNFFTRSLGFYRSI